MNLECEACHDVGYRTAADHKTDGSVPNNPPNNINTLHWRGKDPLNDNTNPNVNTAHLKSGYFKLPFQGFGIHPDAHRRKLESSVKNRVPDEDVAVEAWTSFSRGDPIVVVGGTAVVRLAVAQRRADPDDEMRVADGRPACAPGIRPSPQKPA